MVLLLLLLLIPPRSLLIKRCIMRHPTGYWSSLLKQYMRTLGCFRLLSVDQNLLVGAALHDAGEFAVVEFATSGLDLVEHLGNLGLGETVGLDATVAEEGLDGIDAHLAGGGGVEQVPAGHDGLLGVGSGHLLTEELEEHLEVEGTGASAIMAPKAPSSQGLPMIPCKATRSSTSITPFPSWSRNPKISLNSLI